MILSFHKKALNSSPTKQTTIHKEIINISKNTSEKIQNKNLNKFLETSLIDFKSNLDSNSKIFFSHFEDKNIYEIFLINGFTKADVFYPLIFSNMHDDKYNELFISQEYFVLYSFGQMKLFKNLNDTSREDILEFIKQKYEVSIDKIHKIDADKEKELLEQYQLKKSKPHFISLKRDNSIKYFLTFCFLVLLIPILHFNLIHKDTLESNNEKLESSIKKRYTNILKNKESKKSKYLLNTISQIKSHSLNLNSITLNKNKIHLFLEAKNKSELLSFVDTYDGNIKISNLSFNPQNKYFNMEALVVF